MKLRVLFPLLSFSLLISSSALAATIEVGTTADANNGSNCSLRDAISSLNNAALQGGCSNSSGDGFGNNDTVMLPAGNYTLTESGSPNDDNDSGDLDIRVNMRIQGADPTNPQATTIDAVGLSPRDRVFDIIDSDSPNSITVVMDSLNIINGRAPDSTDSGDPRGGGIRVGNENSLEISNSRVADNRSGDGTPENFGTLDGGDGGGIYQAGSFDSQTTFLRVVNTVIEGNQTGDAVVAEPVSTGGASGGIGGGIYSAGDLTVDQSIIRNNHTGSGALGNTSGGAGGIGGGIFHEGYFGTTLLVSQSTISENTTGNGGNAVNTAGGSGGGGGGIYATATGASTVITQSTFSGNSTGNGGTAGSTIGGRGGDGGGIYLNARPFDDGFEAGIGAALIPISPFAILSNNTITGNSTGDGGDAGVFGGSGGNGGGVNVEGDSFFLASVTLNNNTIVENQTGIAGTGPNGVGSGGSGGGIHVPGFVSNGEGPQFTVPLANNIVANNQVAADGEGVNCFGTTLLDAGYNLESETDCNFTNNGVQNSDPMLGPLAFNGGPTQTRALLVGSLALDAGNPDDPAAGFPNCETEDQRGVSRPQGLRCDIGAFEAQIADLSVTKTVDKSPVEVNDTITFEVTVTNNGPTDADAVTLEDNLPAGITLLSASPGQGTCAVAGLTIACDLGAIANGASVVIVIEATSAAEGDYVNTASVSFSGIDPDPSNNSSSVAFQVVSSGGLIEGSGCQLGSGPAKSQPWILLALGYAFFLLRWRFRSQE